MNSAVNGATNSATNNAVNSTVNSAVNGATNNAVNSTVNGAVNGATNNATNSAVNGATTSTVGPLRRNKDFAALWSGQVASALGARISGTAMPLLVLATGGSPADAGLVAAAGSLPFLVAGLPAGPLVDRWNRRTILLVSETSAAVAVAGVPVALWWGEVTVAYLAVVAFLQGLCSVFFGLAERAALPLIVPAAQLPAAMARNEARTRGAGLLGPPLGGLLFAAGRAVPFLVDVMSYVASAVALLLVRKDLRGHSHLPMWAATKEGLRWAWRHPLVRAAILLMAVSNLVFQALVLILVVSAHEHGATSVGLMLGLYSAGGLAGALAAARLHRLWPARRVIVGVNWVWAGLLPLFALATTPLALGALGAACAFVGPLFDVVLMTYASVLVPNELLGRVLSAAMTVTWGVLPLASLLAGFLVTTLTVTGAIGVLALLMLAAAIAATAGPAVRKAPPLPSDPRR